MIGILNAYHWDNNPQSYQALYKDMFINALKVHFPKKNIKVYNLPQGDLPHSPSDCELWFISGSAKSVYETDITWIQRLIQFIQKCDQQKSKVIGLCFGHQLVAQALGGKVAKSPKGWGVGLRQIEVLMSPKWMDPPHKTPSLIYSHQDQVIQLPNKSEHIGRSDFCEFEIYQVENHILCFQGHPEFTKDFASSRYKARVEMIGKDVVEKACMSLEKSDDSKTVWQWISNFSL